MLIYKLTLTKQNLTHNFNNAILKISYFQYFSENFSYYCLFI